jgi:hypothetical protein
MAKNPWAETGLRKTGNVFLFYNNGRERIIETSKKGTGIVERTGWKMIQHDRF